MGESLNTGGRGDDWSEIAPAGGRTASGPAADRGVCGGSGSGSLVSGIRIRLVPQGPLEFLKEAVLLFPIRAETALEDILEAGEEMPPDGLALIQDHVLQVSPEAGDVLPVRRRHDPGPDN